MFICVWGRFRNYRTVRICEFVCEACVCIHADVGVGGALESLCWTKKKNPKNVQTSPPCTTVCLYWKILASWRWPMSKNKGPLDGAVVWFILFCQAEGWRKQKGRWMEAEFQQVWWRRNDLCSVCLKVRLPWDIYRGFAAVIAWTHTHTHTFPVHKRIAFIWSALLEWLLLASFARSEMPEVQSGHGRAGVKVGLGTHMLANKMNDKNKLFTFHSLSVCSGDIYEVI